MKAVKDSGQYNRPEGNRGKSILSRLSHDHHHGMVMSQRVLKAVRKQPGDLSVLAGQIVQFFDDYMVPHFAMEENDLFPAIEQELGALPLVKKLIAEHQRMRMQVTRFRIEGLEPTVADFREFAQTLERHIRREEEVFSGVERRSDRSSRSRT